MLLRSALPVVAAVCGGGASSTRAVAEIKDYQIARMLNFRTECRLLSLKRLAPVGAEAERFFGECGNLVFYPDGIEVVCPEADDEWTCKIVTKKKSFDNLELLRPPE